ncbi:FAD binding domain-containing protein [Frisingicoccus sp.]|uniref:FAD binding domain-containing protein n=1 Tax=Frisingicoccus sp. TaxID=1918627 RepID=UPI003AB42580
MYTIQGYEKVQSLEEAYELNQKKNSAIIGGGMWLRLGSRAIGNAIDLSNLELNRIEETEDEFVIGCMTSLRDIECHEGLNQYFHGMMKEALKGIVGTQFRNTATIGGSLYQRFGFSDPLTAFLALDTTVEMYAGGMIPLDEFVSMNYDRDILVRIHVKKNGRQAAYQSFRNTKTDFPVLAVGVSRLNKQWKITIGARPARAVVAENSEKLSEKLAESLPESLTESMAEKPAGGPAGDAAEGVIREFAAEVSEKVRFGSNMRASGEYRRMLSEVLIYRAVKDILSQSKKKEM